MTTPLLDVRDLSVTYKSSRGPVPAVRGVSFHLDAGETLGLAGESGSGKSTMTMALLRLVPVGTKVTGTVTLAGEDVLAMKPGRLRAVRWAEAAVVFQGAQHVLNPVRRIAQQIQEAIDVHSGSNKVSDLLEQVGIPALASRCISARAVGRPEAARDDRDVAGLRSGAVDRRRADDGARRDGAGAGAAAARGPADATAAWR